MRDRKVGLICGLGQSQFALALISIGHVEESVFAKRRVLVVSHFFEFSDGFVEPIQFVKRLAPEVRRLVGEFEIGKALCDFAQRLRRGGQVDRTLF